MVEARVTGAVIGSRGRNGLFCGRANGIPTGKSRQRKKIDELESKVALMGRDHGGQPEVSSLLSPIQHLRKDVEMMHEDLS